MAVRATSFRRAETMGEEPFAIVTLDAEARHIRRKRITLANGEDVLVDFERPVHLDDGDRLVLEDGRVAKVVAAPEELMEVRARRAKIEEDNRLAGIGIYIYIYVYVYMH